MGSVGGEFRERTMIGFFDPGERESRRKPSKIGLLWVLLAWVATTSASGVMFSDNFDVVGLDPSWTVARGTFSANAGLLIESTVTPFVESQLLWNGGSTTGPDQIAKLQVVTSATHSWGFIFRNGDPSGYHYEVHLPFGSDSWRWELNNPDFAGIVDSCLGDATLKDGDWLGATVVGTGINAVVSVWRWNTDPDLGGTPAPDTNWGPADCVMTADPFVPSDGLGLGIRSFTGNAGASALADNWAGGDVPVGICGNGIVETAEQCDAGMQTATCNANCTFAACGDGFFNPLAEMCEFDANCNAGQTCTSACACIVTPVCGNSIVEYGEECDDGAQTANCDVDCTFSVCGDGLLNILAGEACEVDADCTGAERCTNLCACVIPSGQLFTDDFSGGPGLPNWTSLSGNFSSIGNALVESTASTFQNTQLRWNGALTDTPDQFAKIQLVDPGVRSWGFMFRLGDVSGHHYEVHLPANSIQWRWELYNPAFVGPVGSCLGDVAVDPGDWIGAAIEGSGATTRVSVWRWNTDPDPTPLTEDPAANWGPPDCQMQMAPSVDVNGGRALGLRSYTQSSTNPSTVDNFTAGDLLTSISPLIPGQIVRILSSNGAGSANSMIDPDGIVVDSMDNVYVAACGLGPTSEGVFKVTPSGVITQVMDSSGDGVNPANCPVGIAVDSLDNVFVSTLLSDNVFQISPAGVVTEVLDATGDGVIPLSGPLGVEVGPDDTVYVAGHYSDNVFALPTSGGVQVILDATAGGAGTPLDAPFGLACDATGNVFVAGFGPLSNAVYKIAPGGAVTIVLDGTGDGVGNVLMAPHGLATSLAGDLYVTGNSSDNVFRVTPGGAVSVIADITGDGAGNLMDNPSSIAVDDLGNVYVAAFASDNGFVIPFGGTPTQIIDFSGDGTTAYGAPSDFVMAFDSLGNMYTAGITEDAVFRIRPVPAPSAVLQLVAGAGLLALLGRRGPRSGARFRL